VKLNPGQRWKGFLAGPIVGVDVHYVGGCKACRKKLTGGALKCICDGAKVETRWAGYVPLWDEYGARFFVVLGERHAENALRVELLHPVVVMKTVARGCPLRIDPVKWTATPPPLAAHERRPQDLRRWLFKIWKDEELEEWCKNHQTRDTTPAPAALESVTDTPRKEKVIRGFAKAVTDARKRGDGPQLLGDILDQQNGKHG
jgi:hypothetical protein